MNTYSKNISPDSLSGAIFAIEGIKDACVILNGPTGCKFYHSAVSDGQYIRSMSFDATQYSEEFYFGQPRIPCTYLDGDDYVYGSGDKLEKILDQVIKKDYKFIAIINSPGAALIGDDLNGFLKRKLKNTPFISLENTGYSSTYGAGYENAIIRLIDSLDYNEKKLDGKNVNIIGLSIYQKYFRENYKKIRQILKPYGINVLSAFGVGDSIEDIKNMVNADLNIVIYPEYGRSIAKKLEKDFDIPYIVLKEGPPIGFYSTESMLEEVCSFFNIDYKKNLENIEKARARSYLHIARYSSFTGLPKGASFSIKAEPSTAYALCKWLVKYLGMTPSAINLLEDRDEEFENKLKDFLTSINCQDSLKRQVLETDTDILLADGNTISQLKLKGYKFSGIEIGLPSIGYIDILPKTLFAEEGSLYLIEQVLNGLNYI